jgi:HAMP domain-containing protein/type II secretory pathway pseudopilin PulG
MGLRLKFNLILALCLLAGLLASAVLFYQVSQQSAKEQLQSQIAVLRAQALGVRKYTSEEVKPLLASQSEVQFIPQTIPSFSAQAVFNNFREQFPTFAYKEAALNPTNPADLAVDWERELIEKLKADPAGLPINLIRTVGGGRQYTVAYPLVIRDAACLACHTTPEIAPASMVALYGRTGGYGWKLNEVVGAQIFSVPLEATEKQIWRNMLTMLGSMTAIFGSLLGLLNILLSRLVIGPVTEISRIAERVSMGEADVPEYTHHGSHEIESLAQSFTRMRRSLDSAMKMLES